MSDIVLNDSSATEGKRRCLDFIPGNNFLGIAASQLYKEENDYSWLLFHSGHVRFGDAHPARNGNRGLRIPASFFRPKQHQVNDGYYIHHLLKETEQIKQMQLKQCREGFYVFSQDRQAIKIPIDKDFSIKSAYDADLRRSKDKQIFGYESLCKGLTMYFDVEIDDDASSYKQDIIKALCGEHHVGRSRSAQYGWVQIMEERFIEVESSHQPLIIDNSQYIAVYADARLIFLDQHGNSTFQPTTSDLGIIDPEAKISWELSQIRTFQYAPWNSKRQSFDCDRCGIEKGSVFIVKTSTTIPVNNYVGVYQTEGFGKVIYNPDFLQAENGKSLYEFKGNEEMEEKPSNKKNHDSPLIQFLRNKKEQKQDTNDILKKVNKFVEENKSRFTRKTFASQWGSIRSLAMVAHDEESLSKHIKEYISHGIAKEKWEERGRATVLVDFINENKGKGKLQEAIINLAAEMSKISNMKEE